MNKSKLSVLRFLRGNPNATRETILRSADRQGATALKQLVSQRLVAESEGFRYGLTELGTSELARHEERP